MLERLIDDQRERWRRGDAVTVDDYLARHPELRHLTETFRKLIDGEIALRIAAGQQASFDEYLRKYPFAAQATLAPTSASDSTFAGGIPAIDANATFVARPANPLDAAVNANDTLPPIRPALVSTPDAFETLPPQSATVGDRTVAGGGGPPRRDRRAEATLAGGGATPHDADATFIERRATPRPEVTDGLSEEQRAMLEGRPYIPGYEIIGELGRGGMGVVYRALHEATNRLVALKVVRNEVLETISPEARADTLERFRHEARAAAKLEHDNIVTVYEVSEVRGLRYYAMRHVTGRSLIEFLRDGPLENRAAAGYIEPIARGLQYAHEKGILHRDLKPHNIMIDEASDRPLLTDFGLAKFMDQGQQMTLAGEVMGTPAYMSPEQAKDAGKVTGSADLYSLGATLYHLLTARPPFQAAGIAETLRQIQDDEPVAPRQLNPAIDRDLETICLKCLQKEPAKRYADCGALALDLARYLRHEPIQARPVGLPERLWRWGRRNPVTAGLIAFGVGSAVVAVAAMVIGYRNTSAALETAEARLRMALGVVEELFTRVSEDELLNEPGMQGLRKDLLSRALKHYQFFLNESGGDPSIRDETAAARFRVGLIAQLTGDREEARRQIAAAAETQRELLNEHPDDVPRMKALATSLNALGNVLERIDATAAIKSFQEAETLRARLDEIHPDNIESARQLANTRMNIALLEAAEGNIDVARTLLETAQTARAKLLLTHPEERKTRRDLAKGYFGWAMNIDTSQKQAASAIAHLRDAEREFSLLLKNDQRSLDDRYLLGQTRRWLGWKLLQRNELDAARDSYEAARTVTEALAEGNPDVEKYQIEAATLALDRGDLYAAREDWPTAREAYLHARAKLNSIVAKNPRSLDSLRLSAGAGEALADVEAHAGDLPASRAAREVALETLRRLQRESPDPTLEQGIEHNEKELQALERRIAEQKHPEPGKEPSPPTEK